MPNVTPTNRLAVSYKDIMKLKGVGETAASSYLTTLRASLNKKERGIITFHEVAADMQIDLKQVLDCLGEPYKLG